MKNLRNLLENIEYRLVNGSLETEVKDVVYDSRKVSPGSLFVCIQGANVDGHDFIPNYDISKIVEQLTISPLIRKCEKPENFSGFFVVSSILVSLPVSPLFPLLSFSVFFLRLYPHIIPVPHQAAHPRFSVFHSMKRYYPTVRSLCCRAARQEDCRMIFM